MRKILTLLALGLSMVTTSFAITTNAAAWEPNKPIDFIMAGKGGGADKMARLMQGIVESEGLLIVRLCQRISLAVLEQRLYCSKLSDRS